MGSGGEAIAPGSGRSLGNGTAGTDSTLVMQAPIPGAAMGIQMRRSDGGRQAYLGMVGTNGNWGADTLAGKGGE